ncbi:MAG: uroporphyrinogen decarboxylase family protein [Armatimonadota bacterium]
MNRRERLNATIRGEKVDRPAVSFYELGGFAPNLDTEDPFNVYTSPSWKPLLEMAYEQTDIIRFVAPAMTPSRSNCASSYIKGESYIENGSRFIRTTIQVAGRTLTALTRQDPDVATIWNIEHLLKDADDLKAYLRLPDEVFDYDQDVSPMVTAEKELGDAGIVMVDTADPICIAASLFSMEDYTVMAFTERELFHELLAQISRWLHRYTAKTSELFPGRLWRIYGPEYATEPYLPPSLYNEYVVGYTKPMVDMIHAHGGFARIHSHGRIKSSLPYIMEMGADAIDPIEPPPLGDVELADVRREYGDKLVLFGNIEIRDIENMEPSQFEKVVAKSLADGTQGEGRGFVLMPSSAAYGREITPLTLANYSTMVRLAQQF